MNSFRRVYLALQINEIRIHETKMKQKNKQQSCSKLKNEYETCFVLSCMSRLLSLMLRNLNTFRKVILLWKNINQCVKLFLIMLAVDVFEIS